MTEITEFLELLQNKPETGIKLVEKFLEENDPPAADYSRLTYGLAIACFQLERNKQAHDWLKLTEDPKKYQMIGFNWLKMEEFEKAAEAFDVAGKENPEEKAECDLIKAQAHALAGELDRSREIINGLLDQDLEPDFRAECRLNRGTVEIEANDKKSAKDWFAKIIEDATDDKFKSEAAFHMLQLEQAEGRLKAAAEHARWLKKNGGERFWREAGMDFLKKFKLDGQKRRNKLRSYEY